MQETASSDNSIGISDKHPNPQKRTKQDQQVSRSADGNLAMKRKRKHPSATWTVDKVNLLIDLLEERTCLWDIFSQTYQDREKKQIAYNEIGDELDISIEEVKTKVMNLRTQLERELAKVGENKSGERTSDLYKPTWTYWERLQFLCQVINPGKSKDNLSLSPTSDDGKEDMKALKQRKSPQQIMASILSLLQENELWGKSKN